MLSYNHPIFVEMLAIHPGHGPGAQISLPCCALTVFFYAVWAGKAKKVVVFKSFELDKKLDPCVGKGNESLSCILPCAMTSQRL